MTMQTRAAARPVASEAIATIVTIGAVMALVLILRPSGLTGGREFGWRRR